MIRGVCARRLDPRQGRNRPGRGILRLGVPVLRYLRRPLLRPPCDYLTIPVERFYPVQRLTPPGRHMGCLLILVLRDYREIPSTILSHRVTRLVLTDLSTDT